jgi:hypothetical protein
MLVQNLDISQKELLTEEIKSSFPLIIWNKISKVKPLLKPYRTILLTLTMLGFINYLFFLKYPVFIWINLIAWIPGVVFAFFAAPFHIMTGKVLRKLSKKYNVNLISLQEYAHNTLN